LAAVDSAEIGECLIFPYILYLTPYIKGFLNILFFSESGKEKAGIDIQHGNLETSESAVMNPEM